MMNFQNSSSSSSTYQAQEQIQPLPQYTAIEQNQEHLRCPRCDSDNTKFCYYNNYNLSQPRHYCKSCRRYWTKGGTLRKIPVGGTSRKNTKRSANTSKKASVSGSVTVTASTSASASVSNTVNSGFKPDHDLINGAPVDHKHNRDHDHDQGSMVDVDGSFSSLMAGFNQQGSGIRTMQFGDFSENLNSSTGLGFDLDPNPVLDLDLERGNHPEIFSDLHSGGDSSCWNNGGGGARGGDNGLPDLAI